MAFVIKSKRGCTEKIGEADELGPGEYLSQSLIKSIKPSKASFMTTTLKRNNYSNDNPGPGEYYQDTTQMNYMKNITKEQYYRSQIGVDLNNADHNKPSLGIIAFMQKDKRFKFNDPKNMNPSPGFYFPPLISKMEIFNKSKALKIKKTQKPKQVIALRKESSVPSIPLTQNNAFEILSKGNITKNRNPEMYKTFTGKKGDTIGPGCYEIDCPKKKWHNTGTEWSKFKAQRMKQLNRSINKGTMDNSKVQLMLSLNTTSCTDVKSVTKPKFLMKKCKIVKGSLLKGSKLNQSFNKQETNQRVIDYKGKSKDKLNNGHILQSLNNNNSPGPGYYYDIDKMTSFKIQNTPEVNQFFGSKNERFLPTKELNQISPATYFRNAAKSETSNSNSISNNINCKKKNKPNEKEYHNRRKQNKLKSAFSTTEKRFNKSEIIVDSPGPGTYNFLDQINTNSSKSLIDKTTNFGSTEKRFGRLEKQLKNEFNAPGPGSYFDSTTTAELNTIDMVNWKGIISGGHKTQMNDFITNLSFIKASNRSREVSPSSVPPVGLYNPDIVYTIDYKIKKNQSNCSPDEIAFNSAVTGKIVPILKSSSGPGYYHKERAHEKKQIYPPFHQSEQRKLENVIEKKVVGPGDYHHSDSYFNWNKKTFNTNYA